MMSFVTDVIALVVLCLVLEASIDDNSVENQGLHLFSTLSFLMGACLSKSFLESNVNQLRILLLLNK